MPRKKMFRAKIERLADRLNEQLGIQQYSETDS